MATLTRDVIDSRINCCNSAGQIITLSLYQCIANKPVLQEEPYHLQNQHIHLSVHEGALFLEDNIPLPVAGWASKSVRPGTLPRFLLINRNGVPGMELNFIGTDDPRPCTDQPLHRLLINSDGIFLAVQEGNIAIHFPSSTQDVVCYPFSKPCP